MGASRQAATNSWVGRPIAAIALRIALFVFPGFLAWIAVRFGSHSFYTPPGRIGLVLWVLQAFAVAFLVSSLTSRASDRFAPLTALLRLSLVFPDAAPSRFSTALRAGSTRKLSSNLAGLDEDVNVAAGQAIELVVQLGKHERLTRGHIERVRAYGEMIGKELRVSGPELDKLRWGLLLHDVGKLLVPADILNKNGPPDAQEWEILRRHPGDGQAILEPLRPWLGEWLDAAGHHHERWDGEGYPSGLAATEISLAGRVCAVADAYDVITSKRSYKKAQPREDARRELVRAAGSHFDPNVVRAMLRVGIARQHSSSLVGWLLELPGAARLTAQIRHLPPGSMGLAIGLAVTGLGTALAPPVTEAPPQDVAFVGEIVDLTVDAVIPQTTISSTVATSTVVTETADPFPETTTTNQTTQTSATSLSDGDQTTSTISPTTISTTTTLPAMTTTAAATTTATLPAMTTTTAATTTTTTLPTTTTTIATTTTTSEFNGSFIQLGAGDMPPSFAGDQFESADSIFLFLEAESATLANPLTVQQVDPGVWVNTDPGRPRITLPAGTVICSWFLHFDPSPGVANISATIDLPSTILGFVGQTSELNDSDFLAVPGVDYNYDLSEAGSDSMRVNGSTFAGSFTALAGRVDHMRVFTAC